MTTSLKTILADLKKLSERSPAALARKKERRSIEVGANPRGYPKQPVGSKPIDLNAWPHNKVRKPTWSIKKPDLLDEPEMGETSPEARAHKAFRRKDAPKRPAGSKGSTGTPVKSQDSLPPAPGLIARAARHKKAGIESPLLMRLLAKRKALQPKGEALTYEELQMSEHAMLNEETGELEVSDEVSALLDGMVAVLESAGYDIEDGMEAEEFVEQVYDLLETDKDLEGDKKQALIKSYNTVVDVIEAAHCDDDDDDSDDSDDGDDDEKDSKKDDDGDDKKPFFLKKKAKKDDDAENEDGDTEEAVEAEEAVEGEEQEESSIVQQTLKHAAQKGYSPGWSAHKAGKPGVPATNKLGAYSVKSVRPNKGPKAAKMGQKRIPTY